MDGVVLLRLCGIALPFGSWTVRVLALFQHAHIRVRTGTPHAADRRRIHGPAA